MYPSLKQLQQVAKNIVNVNLGVKEKDVVTISAGPNSLKFAEAIAYECAIRGAQPAINYGSDELSLKIYKKINPKFLRNWPKLADVMSKVVDVQINLDEENPFLARQLPQNKIEIRKKTSKPIKRRVDKRLLKKDMKVALVGFPTKESAKALGLSFEKLNKIFWDTMSIDYNELYQHNQALMKKLDGAREIVVDGPRTYLEVSVRGRKFINACGIVEKKGELGYINLPDGEVFIAPVENGTNGEIYFDLPCMWHFGKQVEGVWFKFRKGRVVDYQIEKGEKNFEDVLKNASGKKDSVAEFSMGTNPKAKPTGGMTIVDEKVRGTMHMAIGDNKVFGGKNESTIHWDFFKTMTKNSVLSADGKIIMKNGKIV